MTLKITQFGIKITLLFLRFAVKAVPPEYCLYKLNTSDCLGTPTPVFSYYKPGSRCEIEIWRGCPTYNKFDNEYLCSHFCVYNFLKPTFTTPMVSYSGTEQCSHTVTKTCKSGPQNIAYTFNEAKQDCLPLIWGECKTPNIFKEKDECIDTCLGDWRNEVLSMTDDEFKDIDEVLSNFMTPNTTTAKKLKLLDEINSTVPLTPSTTEKGPTLEIPTTVSVVTEESTTKEVTTEVVTTEEVTTTQATTEKLTTEIETEKPTIEEITTEVTTEESTVTTTVPTSTRRIRTRGTDYVSEVQLPD
ncbi:unnamed protein product [Pieris brassicae]|uniref:BPTI/Kunitz inhibitor domain-containing protein n=1 Tax=Pieris brassicae TaxID=7116 RepID=A0A9P0WYJ0_PIEBR|nr:unnamed protein product [Pieris brassicae]